MRKTGQTIFSHIVVSAALLMTTPNGIAENVFKKGEIIRFGVYSGGVKVGNGELAYLGLQNLGAAPTQHIAFKVSTFSVKDEEDIYGTVDFSSPVKVDRKIRLFGREEAIREDYAGDKKSVILKKSVNNGPVTTQEIQSDEEMGNVLLLLYRLRSDTSMQEGSHYKIVLPTQKFDLTVRDKRKIRTPLGLLDTFYLESSPPKYRIWLSDGSRRLPVRIQGLIGAGMAYLAITSVTDAEN